MAEHEPTIIRGTTATDDGVVARLEGEINFQRSPQLRMELMQLIEQRKPRRLVLDMSAVPYMDSSGVATLVEAMQQQRQRSARLVLAAMPDRVKSVFEIARLDMIFTIVPDVEAAKTA